MIQIKRILCPVDFSEFSRRALDRALTIARAHDAAVTVLHVAPAPSSAVLTPVPFGMEGPNPFALPPADVGKLRQELDAFTAVEPALKSRVSLQVCEAPSVQREILTQAGLLEADLIVVGTHGRSAVERLLLGSTTERIIRHARVPVLAVPDGEGDLNAVPFERMLCAVDFSATAMAGLEYAASLSERPTTRLMVLHVLELLPVVYEPSMAVPFDFERHRPALERASLEELRKAVPASIRGKAAVEEIVASGRPGSEILREAAERRADLIVLGIHGHNALDRLLFGSTAEYVVRRAACPVLSVRVPEPQVRG